MSDAIDEYAVSRLRKLPVTDTEARAIIMKIRDHIYRVRKLQVGYLETSVGRHQVERIDSAVRLALGAVEVEHFGRMKNALVILEGIE